MSITRCLWACWASSSSLAMTGLDVPEIDPPEDPLCEEDRDSESFSETSLSTNLPARGSVSVSTVFDDPDQTQDLIWGHKHHPKIFQKIFNNKQIDSA